MKKILSLYIKDNRDAKYPISSKKYRLIAQLMSELAEKKNITLYHASIYWFDGAEFRDAWVYRDKHWTKESVKPDLVWIRMKTHPRFEVKLNFISAKFPLVNSLQFEKLNNKEVLGTLLSPWMPKIVKINSLADYLNLPLILPGKKRVLKPMDGSCGDGVEIVDTNKLSKLKNKRINILAQEFIDSTNGIKGICSSYHDLRLVFLKNKIAYAYIREPQKGKLLANLAQGGKMTLLKTSKIPKEVRRVAKKILQVIAHFNPMYYTLDFVLDASGKPYLLEMNTSPGNYFDKSHRHLQKKFFNQLLKVFKKRT